MNIKTIQEAKKYIGKTVYTANNFHAKHANAKNKVQQLHIGGVHLFYNTVNYEVIGFELYEDAKCTVNWGEVKLKDIHQTFESTGYRSYYFAKSEAEKYCVWLNKDDEEKRKESDIETAKTLLNEHSVKYEIFD